MIIWLRDIPLWYWGWCVSTVCAALALISTAPTNTWLLIVSVLCSLVLITNHVFYSLVTHAKNSKFFQDQ